MPVDLANRFQAAAPAALFAALLSVPVDTVAQTPACDQLKTTLTARIGANGRRDFVLEAVPADAVPADARVVGNCEAGRYKVLLRRGVGAAAAPAASAPVRVARAAVASAPAAVPAESPRPAQRVASAPAAVGPSAARPAEAPSPPSRVDAAPATLGPVVSAPLASSAPAAVPAASAPVRTATPVAFGPLVRHWPWAAGAALALAAVLAWLWRTRWSPYDAAGLPRGPRL